MSGALLRFKQRVWLLFSFLLMFPYNQLSLFFFQLVLFNRLFVSFFLRCSSHYRSTLLRNSKNDYICTTTLPKAFLRIKGKAHTHTKTRSSVFRGACTILLQRHGVFFFRQSTMLAPVSLEGGCSVVQQTTKTTPCVLCARQLTSFVAVNCQQPEKKKK